MLESIADEEVGAIHWYRSLGNKIKDTFQLWIFERVNIPREISTVILFYY